MPRTNYYKNIWYEHPLHAASPLLLTAYPEVKSTNGLWPATPEMLRYAELLDTQVYLSSLGLLGIIKLSNTSIRLEFGGGRTIALEKIKQQVNWYSQSFDEVSNTLDCLTRKEFYSAVRKVLGNYAAPGLNEISALGFPSSHLAQLLSEAEQRVVEQIGGSLDTFYLIVESLEKT